MIRARRSQPVPATLSKGKSWRGKDVCDALYEDFCGKCYLCERALTRGYFEVDHRRPQGAFAEHRFSWDNLFPACRGCNGGRPTSYPDGSTRQYPETADLLDPTADDVEALLSQTYDLRDNQIRFDARSPRDLSAAFTAHELEHLHNARTARAEDLRSAIYQWLVRVLHAKAEYYRLRDRREAAEAELNEATSVLRRLLSRRAPFTALTRSVVADLAHLFD